MGKTFVISDESVNNHGFRTITAGIDLSDFLKNPIMLWAHTRSYSDKTDTILPIGKWENIRVEGDKLLADAVFDMEDPFAAKISKKVDKGMINACSINIRVLEESSDPLMIIQGQRYATVTRSKLREISITDIGSNASAVRLSDENGNIIELSAGGNDVPLASINNVNQNQETMKIIALKLGLPETATEAEILAKIADNDKKLSDANAENKKLKDEQTAAQKKTITSMVDEAIRTEKLTADKKDHFIALGEKLGVDGLQTTLSALHGTVRPGSFIKTGAEVGAPGEAKKLSDLKADDIVSLRSSDPAQYTKLFEAEYGFKPEIE